jgi:hypothetical protein
MTLIIMQLCDILMCLNYLLPFLFDNWLKWVNITHPQVIMI